jgi:hypothetical protein
MYLDAPTLAKWELEARLLTEQPYGEIASHLDCSGEVVAAYHDVFFDVRRRLHATGWIANHVIKARSGMGLQAPDTGQLLKHVAFIGGAFALESLLDFYRNPPVVPERPELLDPECFRQLCSKLVVNSSVLGHSILVNAPRALQKVLLVREATDRIHAAGQFFEAASGLTGALSVEFAIPDAKNRLEIEMVGGQYSNPEPTHSLARRVQWARAA